MSLAIHHRRQNCYRPHRDGSRRALRFPAIMVVPRPRIKCGFLNGRDGGGVEGCQILTTKGGWNHPRNLMQGPSKWGLRRLTKWSQLARVMTSRENVRSAREDVIAKYANSPMDHIPLGQLAASTTGEQAKVGE